MIKEHKNTAGVKCQWIIGILLKENKISFVTSIDNKNKTFRFNEQTEPYYFDSKTLADDYALGMMLNGFPAIVAEIPKGYILTN